MEGFVFVTVIDGNGDLLGREGATDEATKINRDNVISAAESANKSNSVAREAIGDVDSLMRFKVAQHVVVRRAGVTSAEHLSHASLQVGDYLLLSLRRGKFFEVLGLFGERKVQSLHLRLLDHVGVEDDHIVVPQKRQDSLTLKVSGVSRILRWHQIVAAGEGASQHSILVVVSAGLGDGHDARSNGFESLRSRAESPEAGTKACEVRSYEENCRGGAFQVGRTGNR